MEENEQFTVGGIGPKLADFYLSLNNQTGQTLVDAIAELECYTANEAYGEDSALVTDIVNDCRKKCAQYIRAKFGDHLRSLIAGIRRKLALKTAKDGDIQHSQRHLNCLIELLGTWSNMIQEVHDYYISLELLHQILVPLYTRVLEVAYECFKSFKTDKNLSELSSKLLHDQDDVNMNTLDMLISQVSSMREIINHYHQFVRNVYLDERYHYIGNITQDIALNNSHLQLITTEEISNWRELDLFYTTFEYGYLNAVLRTALQDQSLLELESNTYSPQCFEDIFFIFTRVSERAVTTGSESCIFAIGNKIVELIDLTCNHDDGDDNLFYSQLCKKSTYHQCMHQHQISIAKVSRRLDRDNEKRSRTTPLKRSPARNKVTYNNEYDNVNTTQLSSNKTSSSTLSSFFTNNDDNSTAAIANGNTNTNTNKTIAITSAGNNNNLINEVATAGLFTVNQWLSDLTNTYIPKDDTSSSTNNNAHNDALCTTQTTNNANNAASITSTSNKQTSAKIQQPQQPGSSSIASINELLINALNNDASLNHNSNHHHHNNSNANNNEIDSIANLLQLEREIDGDDDFQLDEEDWIVQINAISMVTAAVQSIHAIYAAYYDDVCSSCGGNGGGSLKIVVHELAMCASTYRSLLGRQCASYATLLFRNCLSGKFQAFANRTFDITGQNYEDQCNTHALFCALKLCFEPNATITNSSAATNNHKTNLKDNDNQTSTTTSVSVSTSEHYSIFDFFGMSSASASNASQEILSIQILKCCFINESCQTQLSRTSFIVVLLELIKLITTVVVDDIVAVHVFNEWGALLLYDEISKMAHYFETIIDDNVTAMSHNHHTSTEDHLVLIRREFELLFLLLKILCLDHPADIRRYFFPKTLVTEQKVRFVLSRRVDFPKEAVAKVKINFLE